MTTATAGMRRRVLAAASVAALLPLPACDSGTGREPETAAPLAAVVVPAVAGLAVEPDATGPLDLATAARSTTTRAAVLEDYLRAAGFRRGYARVFRRGDEFVTALAFELRDDAGAGGLVDLALDELSTSVAFRPFSDPAVPRSRGFTLTSEVAGEVRFCVGEWFPVDRLAFAVTRCAPFVLSVPAVTGIAAAQHARALRAGEAPR